jgi:glycosyltransferase involved in cell wall biosynthesis
VSSKLKQIVCEKGEANLRICMVLQYYFPPDIRVEKEARALVKAGHDVLILCSGKSGMKSEELIDGVRVIRKPEPRNSMMKLYNYILFTIPLIDHFWKKVMSDIVTRYGVEAIHVHDLPLVKTGLAVARQLNVPLVADLHENYAEGMKVWAREWGWSGSILGALIPSWRWEKLEKLCIQQADRVIAVVDEAKNYYVQKSGVRREKVVVVMNVEDLEVFDDMKIDKGILDAYCNDFVISYLGGFQQHRGIDTVIEAMPRILEKIPNAVLLLIGGRGPPAYEEWLEKMCRRLRIEKNVVFTGWLDFKYVPSYIAASAVCLVPHSASGFTDTTIPHKLFQYMALGKPVIATNVKPIKRILEETRSGIVVPSGDYIRMAEGIIKLHDNKEYARKLGINGRKAVETKYNWKHEAKRLVQIYDELEGRRHRRS